MRRLPGPAGSVTSAGRFALAAGFLGLVAAAPARSQGPPVPADTAGVHALWAQLDSTWNAREAERFSGLFTDDASLGFVNRGLSLETRAAIRRHFTEQFRAQRPDLRHATRVGEIRLVAPDVVTVDGEVEVLGDGPDDSAPAVLRRFAITGVMVRTTDGWRIRLLRVYQLSPLPPGSR